MNRKRIPLKHIGDLPLEKQHEIFLLLQRHTYAHVIDLLAKPAPEGIGKKVSRSTLERHYARGCEDAELEKLPEIKKSAGAWLHFKETGETSRFDEAALERIKLKTFELAGTLRDKTEFAQLKGLFQIIFAARLAEVRTRTVAVRERLAILREHHTAPGSARASTSDPSHPVNRSHPSANLEHFAEPEEPNAPVARACGNAPESSGIIPFDEYITHGIRPMAFEIVPTDLAPALASSIC